MSSERTQDPEGRELALPNKVQEILIQNTLGISSFDKGMKNIIINLESATQALNNLLETEIRKARIDENQRWSDGYGQAFLDYPEADHSEDFMAAKRDFEDRIKALQSETTEDKDGI